MQFSFEDDQEQKANNRNRQVEVSKEGRYFDALQVGIIMIIIFLF